MIDFFTVIAFIFTIALKEGSYASAFIRETTCYNSQNSLKQKVPIINYRIEKNMSHDTTCFTQGLTFINDSTLLQTCGLYGKSRIELLDMKDVNLNHSVLPRVIKDYNETQNIFYEGVTVANNSIYLLTWQEHKILQLNKNTLEQERVINYSHHGWGLVYDTLQHTFYATNGSHYIIHFKLDQGVVHILEEVPVYYDGKPLIGLNEMEYDGQRLYVNNLYTPTIFYINPFTGVLEGLSEFGHIVPENITFNGIAYVRPKTHLNDSEEVYLWVTGKLWDKMLLICIQFPRRECVASV
jgi:glutaminyl-peptide cyclotransferase